jgi:hypothetical protein
MLMREHFSIMNSTLPSSTELFIRIHCLIINLFLCYPFSVIGPLVSVSTVFLLLLLASLGLHSGSY